MENLFNEPGNVLIKTYTFESGLFYLAKQLGDLLEKQGHKVFYLQKSKYQLESSFFKRTYIEPNHPEDFENLHILKMSAEQDLYEQILKYVTKYEIKYFINFETLMQKANWIPFLKTRFNKNIKIIEVPMAEWVSPDMLEHNQYKMFDEIWSLNLLTSQIFQKYPALREVSWPLVDSSIFNRKNRKRKTDKINFLHLASTNPNYSSKNTDKVISAYLKFIKSAEPKVPCNLHIQGKLPKNIGNLQDKIGIISQNEEIISRLELGKLYKQTDCVVAPSSREGLSLALYEGLASGCRLITTDAPPMNYAETEYLVKVDNLRRDRSLIQLAEINEQSLYENYQKVYQDIINGK